MHALTLGIAWGLLGLDVGWRPAAGGGVEYIIQIAPHELEIFKQNGIEGDIPPQLKDIRMYRVVVGNDVLPRQDPPPQSASVSTRTSNSTVLPPFSSPVPSQTKAYNPFSSLSSLVSRYPFGQLAAESSRMDSARRDSTKPDSGRAAPPSGWPRSTDSGAERWWRDEPTTVERPAARGSSKETQEAPKEIPKPWLPFTVVVLALFGSLGGNLYMGWITWETRARYHALVRRFRKRAHRSARESGYETDDD